MEASFTARLGNIMALSVLSHPTLQCNWINYRNSFVHRTSALLNTNTGLNPAAVQAQAKELEGQIYNQATSKVLGTVSTLIYMS
jgi:hypothetical protein